MAPCEMYLQTDIYNDLMEIQTTIDGMNFDIEKEEVKIHKVKEQIKRKPIMRMNNIQNKRIYRCQNRM